VFTFIVARPGSTLFSKVMFKSQPRSTAVPIKATKIDPARVNQSREER
jgi:hypothetical protein